MIKVTFVNNTIHFELRRSLSLYFISMVIKTKATYKNQQENKLKGGESEKKRHARHTQ